MTFAFDLISDLHTDSWPEFNWKGQPTSPVCVVAGDAAQDAKAIKKTLTHLGENYQAVLYIDGNDEHRYSLENLEESYHNLEKIVDGIPNVVYLHNNVAIFNHVAFIATNAWITMDWDSRYDPEHCQHNVEQYYGISSQASENLIMQALSDAKYLEGSIKRLQTHRDVKKIIIVTHTVPRGEFVQHDPDVAGCYRINASINSYITGALRADTENKVTTWCFGHYHWPVDQVHESVRYVCNPRGRKNTPWHRDPYFPVRIEV